MTKFDKSHPIWSEVLQIAHASIRRVANRYRGYAAHDDLVQTAMEYAWKRSDKVAEYLDREEEAERKRGIGALSVMLRRVAERQARKEKANKLGYETSDEFFYRPEIVESLIAAKYLGYESAGQVFKPEELGGKRGKSLPNEGGNIFAMVADVEKTLDVLEPRLKYILEARYAHGETLSGIAEQLELSVQRVDQLSRKAMREVVELLGGETPY